MEVKEAIEFVECQLNYYSNPDLVMSKEDIKNKNIEEGIISLLQERDKYEKIVEEIISSRYFSTRDNEYLKSIKQRYFPEGGE